MINLSVNDYSEEIKIEMRISVASTALFQGKMQLAMAARAVPSFDTIGSRDTITRPSHFFYFI